MNSRLPPLCISRALTRMAGVCAWTGLLCTPVLADWHLVGTTVRGDQITPAAGVRITIFPDSLVYESDEQGDFLIPWNGRRGYLRLEPPSGDFCKRIGLFNLAREGEPGRTLDLGPIVAVASDRAFGRGRVDLPNGVALPDSVDAPPPPEGAPDRYLLVMRVLTNMHGDLLTVDQYNVDAPAPEGLRNAIIAHLRTIPWSVSIESPCVRGEPFRGMLPMTYWWRGGKWILLPNLGSRRVQAALLKQLESEAEREAQTGYRYGPPQDSGHAPGGDPR